jgi:RNA polymerase sigma-70 factor, ECF subfamily
MSAFVAATRSGDLQAVTQLLASINGLPGIIVDGPKGPAQTAAFEIDGDVIRALYVVRNSDKLRHLTSAAAPLPDESGRG